MMNDKLRRELAEVYTNANDKGRNVIVVMVGLPASGKSTLAADIAHEMPNTVVLSSDAIREELYGNENYQGNPNVVFRIMNDRVFHSIYTNVNCVYDATNLKSFRRKGFINVFRDLADIVCVFLTTDEEECQRRNKERERTVPKYVIERMKLHLDVPTEDEGFSRVIFV